MELWSDGAMERWSRALSTPAPIHYSTTPSLQSPRLVMPPPRYRCGLPLTASQGAEAAPTLLETFMPPPRYRCGLPLTASQGVEAAPTPSLHLSCLRPGTIAACRSPHPKGWRRPRLHHSIFHASAPMPL